jgi:hypothetical protein
MQALQVYKLASSERRNSIFGFHIIVEETNHQHQQSSSQVDFEGAFGVYISKPNNFNLRLRRYSSTRGARPSLRRRLLRPSASPTQLSSRGSTSTSATTTATAFALADIARLEGLALHFGDVYSDLRPRRHGSARGARPALWQRRLWLRPSPASTLFDPRGSLSTSATIATAFALADTARLEGLALNFRDDNYGLRPRRYNSAQGARPPLRRRLLRPSPSPTQLSSRGSSPTSVTTPTAFALADTARFEGLALHFSNDYYGLHPRRHNSARGARLRLWR